jgi:hypothetical protein
MAPTISWEGNLWEMAVYAAPSTASAPVPRRRQRTGRGRGSGLKSPRTSAADQSRRAGSRATIRRARPGGSRAGRTAPQQAGMPQSVARPAPQSGTTITNEGTSPIRIAAASPVMIASARHRCAFAATRPGGGRAEQAVRVLRDDEGRPAQPQGQRHPPAQRQPAADR